MTTAATVDVREHRRRDALDELRSSARGWHGVQLAVLGFIGLCGALNSGADSDGLGWLQDVAGLLVLLALALACIATVLVASAAWPVYGSARVAPSADEEVHRTGRHLRGGIVLTFVAVAVLAVATSSSWWPSGAATAEGQVGVTTGSGTLCGELVESDAGTLALRVDGEVLVLSLDQVLQVHPVDTC